MQAGELPLLTQGALGFGASLRWGDLEPWLGALSAATPIAVLLAAAVLAGRLRKRGDQDALHQRLAGLERAAALLDRATALSIEIEDRYAKPELRGEDGQEALLSLRRALAETVGEARAAIDAYGELRDRRLLSDVFEIATRPVFVAAPAQEEVERSLERLRLACARMRTDLLELMAALRRRMGKRAWRSGLDLR